MIALRMFEEPDETRVFPKGRLDIIKLGGLTLGRASYEPGWKWSEHVGSTTEPSCQMEHVGLVVSGRAMAVMDDGEAVELTPGAAFHIPPGHDSWVIGDEPYVSIHMLGADHYARTHKDPPQRQPLSELTVRQATPEDRDAIWAILQPIIREGETYALPRDMEKEAALAYWLAPTHEPFVAVASGAVVGTYYLQANQAGGGAHVANCGFMTSAAAAGRGVASTMCVHSLARAKARGFRAMQFNFVVSTNERAVALWRRLGFDVIGRAPAVFQHPRLGFVDALVMHQPI